MGKTLVIFDVDETLVYSDRLDSQSFADTYESMFGKKFPTLDWHQYPHVTDTTILKTALEQHFQRHPTLPERQEFEYQYITLLKANRVKSPDLFKSIPYAKETIDKMLADERFIVAIGTGGWENPARLKLRHIGIPCEKLFFGAADGHETRYAIISHLISEIGKIHEQIKRKVYVGDALWDVRTTRQLGLNFIGIRRRGDAHTLRSQGAETVIKDYSDYNSFIEFVFSCRPPQSPNLEPYAL